MLSHDSEFSYHKVGVEKEKTCDYRIPDLRSPDGGPVCWYYYIPVYSNLKDMLRILNYLNTYKNSKEDKLYESKYGWYGMLLLPFVIALRAVKTSLELVGMRV
jgi:hypothetical protein